MKSLLFKRIFQARKKRIMVYNKIRKVWENTVGPFVYLRQNAVSPRPACHPFSYAYIFFEK